MNTKIEQKLVIFKRKILQEIIGLNKQTDSSWRVKANHMTHNKLKTPKFFKT